MTDETNQAPLLTRRGWLAVAGGAALALAARPLAALAPEQKGKLPTMTVYKSPTCRCCGKWIDHMKAQGFTLDVKDMDDVSPVKRTMGIPEDMWSCHTGVVGKYAVEGHVPADVVKKLLAEKPKAIGIAVPGMPVGSPGMESGSRKDKYDVMLVRAGAKPKVYASR
jgi:hypothetical protein